jgi:hypothetical protein
MKFHEFLPMGAALIHAQQMDRQAGRQMGMTKIIGTFCDYTNTPKMP